MKHPNETGVIQSYKVTPNRARIYLKARFIRVIANLDATWWMLRYRK